MCGGMASYLFLDMRTRGAFGWLKYWYDFRVLCGAPVAVLQRLGFAKLDDNWVLGPSTIWEASGEAFVPDPELPMLLHSPLRMSCALPIG